MKKISDLANSLEPSPTLAIDSKAKQLKADGVNVFNFAAGEPDFDTPEFIKDACKKALDDGKTKYVAAPGIPELRAAIAQKSIDYNKIPNVTPEQVVISPGGKYSCFLAMLATLNPGDEVIIPAPYWASYPSMVQLTRATPVIVDTSFDNNFKLTPEQLKDSISPKTKMLIHNSPSNPTGTVYSKEETDALVEICIENNILILSDEIYEYLVYNNLNHYSPASHSSEAAAITLTTSGFSKTFAMTGWRLGTLVAPAEIAKAVSKLQGQTTSNACSFAQYGALAAYQDFSRMQQALVDMMVHFQRRRDLIKELIDDNPYLDMNRPLGAFYAFAKINNTSKSADFCEALLTEQKVATVPGIAFGAEGYVRFSFATSDDNIRTGLELIKEFCAGQTVA